MQKKINCILLIDDDEPTNFLTSMLIEESGCAKYIKVVQSGQEALNYLANSDSITNKNNGFPCPDLIFLDINMPAMNGWEFLDRYNQLEKKYQGKRIVVMLTTSLNPDDEVKAKNINGVSDFKHKPLTPKILNEVLETYFTDSAE